MSTHLTIGRTLFLLALTILVVLMVVWGVDWLAGGESAAHSAEPTRAIEPTIFVAATPTSVPIPATPPSDLSTPAPTAEPTTATPSSPPLITVGQGGANVRGGPGTNYDRLGYLDPGTQAEVTGRYDDWWRIEYAGGEGWVFSGIVTAIDGEGVPAVEPPAAPPSPMPIVIPPPSGPQEIEELRWIDVDLSDQVLVAYESGTPVRTVTVSTGLPSTPTPVGQFRIWVKFVADDMEGPGYYLADVPYAMYFYLGYGLHGTYWHNNFGHPMSHGCVNLPTSEAEWLFNWADVGTLVNIHE